MTPTPAWQLDICVVFWCTCLRLLGLNGPPFEREGQLQA